MSGGGAAAGAAARAQETSRPAGCCATVLAEAATRSLLATLMQRELRPTAGASLAVTMRACGAAEQLARHEGAGTLCAHTRSSSSA